MPNNTSGNRINRRRYLKVGGVAVATGLAGCAGNPGTGGNDGSTDTGSGGVTTNQDPPSRVEPYMDQLPDYYPDDYWQIVDAAMDEGSMTVYTSKFGAFAEQVFGDFTDLFDFINVETVTLGTAQVYQRYANEAARGRIEPDLVWTYDPIAVRTMYEQDLLENYVSPEIEYYPDRAQTDIDGLVQSGHSPTAHGFNPSALEEAGKEVPTTVAEMVDAIKDDPDFWNQNFAMYDGVTTTSGWQQMDFYATAHGEDTMKSHWTALAEGNPQTFLSTSTMGEWVANGQVVWALGMAQWIMSQFILPDFSTDQIQYGDYIPTNIMWPNYQVAKDASNPNTARLFTDYWLSERGQLNLANTWTIIPARANIDPSKVPEDPFWGVPTTQEVIMEEVEAIDSAWMPFEKRTLRGAKKAKYKDMWYQIFN